MQYSSQQCSLVSDATRFTEPAHQRFGFRQRYGRLPSLVCFFYDLFGEITGMANPHPTRIKILRTEPRGFTQRRTGNAAADVRGPCVVLRKLLTRKIARRPREIRIRKRFEIVSECRSLLQLLRRRSDSFSAFRKRLQRRRGVYRIPGCAFFFTHYIWQIPQRRPSP